MGLVLRVLLTSSRGGGLETMTMTDGEGDIKVQIWGDVINACTSNINTHGHFKFIIEFLINFTITENKNYLYTLP